LGTASHAQEKETTRQHRPEHYREAADDSLELVRVLAGQGGISDQDFLNDCVAGSI
jgi:hypothetical protein